MNIEAIFESWHISDGNYPLFHVGKLVNLSFEIETTHLKSVHDMSACYFISQGYAEYTFRAKLIAKQHDEGGPDIAIFDVEGQGTLLLDHHMWVEFLDEYPHPPDIFYPLCVTKIHKIVIPERYISRYDTGKSYLTRISLTDVTPSNIEEPQTMEGQAFNEEFYLITFETGGMEHQHIPKTFIACEQNSYDVVTHEKNLQEKS